MLLTIQSHTRVRISGTIVHTLFTYSLYFLLYCCRYYLSLLLAGRSDGFRIIYMCTTHPLMSPTVVIYVPINLGLHSFYHARILFFGWKWFSILQKVVCIHVRLRIRHYFRMGIRIGIIIFYCCWLALVPHSGPFLYTKDDFMACASIFTFQKSIVVNPCYANYHQHSYYSTPKPFYANLRVCTD